MTGGRGAGPVRSAPPSKLQTVHWLELTGPAHEAAATARQEKPKAKHPAFVNLIRISRKSSVLEVWPYQCQPPDRSQE